MLIYFPSINLCQASDISAVLYFFDSFIRAFDKASAICSSESIVSITVKKAFGLDSSSINRLGHWLPSIPRGPAWFEQIGIVPAAIASMITMPNSSCQYLFFWLGTIRYLWDETISASFGLSKIGPKNLMFLLVVLACFIRLLRGPVPITVMLCVVALATSIRVWIPFASDSSPTKQMFSVF